MLADYCQSICTEKKEPYGEHSVQKKRVPHTPQQSSTDLVSRLLLVSFLQELRMQQEAKHIPMARPRLAPATQLFHVNEFFQRVPQAVLVAANALLKHR